MPKLNFTQAKSKFKTNEDIFSYFILVESYEKHLDADQKEKFLNPDTIEDMFKVLSDQQLRHLHGLIYVFARRFKSFGDRPWFRDMDDVYGGDGLSEWFVSNLYRNSPAGVENPRLFARDVSEELIKKITKFTNESGKSKKYIKDIIEKYKSKLKKFDGNSVEYRQWLILSTNDHGIPGIEKIYDVTKLLRQFDLRYLLDLKEDVKGRNIEDIILSIRYLEPYFYWLATKSIDVSQSRHGPYDEQAMYGKLDRLQPDEYKSFEMALRDLVSKIEDIIHEKWDLIVRGLEGLSRSTTFYRDFEEILRSIGNVDDQELKDTIAEYSKPYANGLAFNAYLRKAAFTKAILENKKSAVDIDLFRNKIEKVYEYFRRHLTDKEYIVYRGIKRDGLDAMLRTATPKVPIDSSDNYVARQLNKIKPVVFDEGFIGTSLNKGIAGRMFGGKNPDSVLFTIKVPRGSKALVLDYEKIRNCPVEEEVLLAPRTKMKIKSAEKVGEHLEIDAEVIN